MVSASTAGILVNIVSSDTGTLAALRRGILVPQCVTSSPMKSTVVVEVSEARLELVGLYKLGSSDMVKVLVRNCLRLERTTPTFYTGSTDLVERD